MKKLLCIILLGAMLTACTSSPKNEDLDNGGAATEDTTENDDAQAEIDEEYEAFSKRLLEKSDYMPQLEDLKSGDTVALIKTSMGEIKIKLIPEQAPLAVENFVTHAQEDYYDGLTFHRVIEDFMSQTGDPMGNGTGGESIWGGPFEDEFSPYMYHFTGALAMANSGADTNGSQFYIVNSSDTEYVTEYFDYVDSVIVEYGEDELLHDTSTGLLFRTNYSDAVRAKYGELGGTPYLDYGYTIFGQVIEGLDVVDAINRVETDESDKPLEDVTIIDIEISTVE